MRRRRAARAGAQVFRVSLPRAHQQQRAQRAPVPRARKVTRGAHAHAPHRLRRGSQGGGGAVVRARERRGTLSRTEPGDMRGSPATRRGRTRRRRGPTRRRVRIRSRRHRPAARRRARAHRVQQRGGDGGCQLRGPFPRGGVAKGHGGLASGGRVQGCVRAGYAADGRGGRAGHGGGRGQGRTWVRGRVVGERRVIAGERRGQR